MAIYSNILDWRIPWTEELGGLQSTGSQRVEHNWATNAFTFFQCVYFNWKLLIYPTYSPGISLEGMMLKLKLQYFGHLMQRVTHWKRLWCWEGLGGGGEGDDRGWDGWMASLTRWTWVWVNSGGWWWTGRPGVLRFIVSQRVGRDWSHLIWSESPPSSIPVDI